MTFKYDHNGLRTQKTVQTDWLPETTNYFLLGKLLTHMTVEYTDFDEVAHQDKLHFFYDAQSRPAQVSFNGVIYTYIHNLQGDIVGILDNSGALVVEYKYDAWGKLLSVTGNLKDTLGKRNPFRYRGYVYDEETGLYYLRSRYYNPNVGRFVNADTRLGDVGSICSHNVYAYCANIPVLSADPSGREAVILIYAFLEAVATAAATAAEITALASLCFKVGNAIGKTVSSTFAAAGVSSVKVETSAITNPKSLAREITAADVRYLGIESNFITGEAFYVAYAINNTENSPIFFVNYPLTLQQAKSILGMTGLLNDIIDTVSVGYASGVLGVYTPSKASAALLSKEVGGGSVEQEHFSSTDFPGTYFWHYDGPGHNYHIWYGLPLS